MYNRLQDLPKSVRNSLPKHAQEIYKSAYNNATEEYSSESNTEERAHRVAWSAVKQKYRPGDDTWKRK